MRKCKDGQGFRTLAGFLLFFTRALKAGCEDGAFGPAVGIHSLLLRRSLTSPSSLSLLVSTGFLARRFTFEWMGASPDLDAIFAADFLQDLRRVTNRCLESRLQEGALSEQLTPTLRSQNRKTIPNAKTLERQSSRF